MLKNVYNHYRLMEQASHILTTDNMDIIKYKWGEIIDEYNRRINYEHRI